MQDQGKFSLPSSVIHESPLSPPSAAKAGLVLQIFINEANPGLKIAPKSLDYLKCMRELRHPHCRMQGNFL
jgi:hypothetical protein